MTDTDPIWLDDEPPRTVARGGRDWIKLLAPLRTQPGRWAIVATFDNRSSASTSIHNLRVGLMAGCKPGEFDGRIVPNPAGGYGVAAVYLDGTEEAER